MTNYNERLATILKHIYLCGENDGLGGKNTQGIDATINKAKQALTSLTKELVAEAKPEKKSTEDYGSWEEGHRNAGWNNCLEHFEQNLLKALEEV